MKMAPNWTPPIGWSSLETLLWSLCQYFKVSHLTLATTKNHRSTVGQKKRDKQHCGKWMKMINSTTKRSFRSMPRNWKHQSPWEIARRANWDSPGLLRRCGARGMWCASGLDGRQKRTERQSLDGSKIVPWWPIPLKIPFTWKIFEKWSFHSIHKCHQMSLLAPRPLLLSDTFGAEPLLAAIHLAQLEISGWMEELQ